MGREIANCKLQIANCKLRKTSEIREIGAERSPFRYSRFSIFNPSRHPLHGFTLVELLVVITIIGILLAIILPAVNMIREDARQTTCMNNQMQIGKAIVVYEDAKRHLPGVLNQGSYGTPPVAVSYTWVAALFPYLDRADMWDKICGNKVADLKTMRLNIVICPNDPYLIDPTSVKLQALLSYGINDSVFVSYLSNPAVNRNGTKVLPPLLSKLAVGGKPVNSATTIMIGERTGDGTLTYPRAGTPTYLTAGKWTDVTPAATAWNSLTFAWPAAAVTISPNIMVSNHPNKVVVTFFDGHGEKVNVDAMYPQ